MKNRLLTVILMLSLLITALPTVSAAPFTDTEGHWAGSYIEEVVEQGLFNGVGDNCFLPDGTMTRAMFITVLGRFEGIDEEYWSGENVPQFFKQDVDELAYYAPHIRWGVCNGIVNGMTDFTFAPDLPITREQMAKLVAYYIENMGHELLPVAEGTMIPESFTDEADISSWALPSVQLLCESGILNGHPNGDGSYAFRPQATASRAECAAVFSRILHSVIKNEAEPIYPQHIVLEPTEISLQEGQSATLTAYTLPDPAPLLWRSSDRSIVKVSQDGTLSYVAPGHTTVTVYTGNGLYSVCQVTCEEPTEPTPPDTPPAPNLPSADMTKQEKCEFIFGEAVSDPRLYYTDRATAEADMVNVEIRTWDLNRNGEKYTREWTLKVHKSLAKTVKVIFEEIYNGEEQFPIHDVYCFSWSGKSEHSIGCAIDINYEENYYCDPNGNALVGNYWKPGEDPYSIPPDGDLVKAFNKYGYIWGIYWNSGYRDYMHFSFFGT